MNLSPKQGEVRNVIHANNLAVCAILESHIASSRLDTTCQRVFRHWNWASNSSSCLKGTRIILGWNSDVVDTSIISHSDQVLHARIWIKAERKELFCSFIYAHNRYTHRRGLWNSLKMHKHFIRDRPWCILGDFNAALFFEDTLVGSSVMDISMREFRDCIDLDLTVLVKERYRDSRPEGYDLMLWGDLHTVFESNEDDELWQNQHQYNLISWSLYDFCGIHMLLMDNGMAIHMLTEKKYPLSQEMISKMLKKRLEVDHESTQAIELLRFIRSQVKK
ncbi:RNA-directed DNA polymerase, eukaryota, reverse transcriptase zinc-binding domain protein [Tanacetum coccineum]